MKQGLLKQLQDGDIISGKYPYIRFSFSKLGGYPDLLNELADALWVEMDSRTTCVAGTGYGGFPFASIISSRHHSRLTVVVQEPKQYGRRTWAIEGYPPTREDGVAIVDDVFTNGEILRKMIHTLRPTGAEILGCYVILKRGKGELDVPLSYLFSPEDLR